MTQATADGMTLLYAPNLARQFLAKNRKRWLHTQGVAMKASFLADLLPLSPTDKVTAVCAAWLHDIGYEIPDSPHRWHPLDGAETLARYGFPVLARYVAWHTTAFEEAELLNLRQQLVAYLEPDDLVMDIVNYADLTVSSDGAPVTALERVADITSRYEANSTQVRALTAAWPRLREGLQRIDALLPASPFLPSI